MYSKRKSNNHRNGSNERGSNSNRQTRRFLNRSRRSVSAGRSRRAVSAGKPVSANNTPKYKWK